MTPQFTNAQVNPDARINHVLEALRTTTPPAGLQERVAQRIAARLAQAAEARQASAPQTHPLITTDIAADPSLFTTILNAVKAPRNLLAPAKLYAAAAALTLLLTLTTITLHHHTPTTTAQSLASSPSFEGAGLQSRRNTPSTNPGLAAEGISHLATTHAPQAFSFRPHSPIENVKALATAQQPNLDTIALAETRAPSRPAPPMPLTAQEHLLLTAARPGQPIQLAELDIARAPFLRAAAEAREDANIRRYVKTLLAPFAVADALSINSQPQEISTTAPAPQPPTSLTN